MTEKVISLRSAMDKVRKAHRVHVFAIERGYPCWNFENIARRDVYYHLSWCDQEKFDEWYDGFMADNPLPEPPAIDKG